MKTHVGRELLPGVHQITVAMPMALNHVHYYLVEGSDGYLLVDTGLSDPQPRRASERAVPQRKPEADEASDIWLRHAR